MTGPLKVHSRRWRSARMAAIALAAALFARAAERGAWDFRLPTLAGDRFVRASGLSGPVLVNFWGRHCPPCIEELPRLQMFAGAHRNWTVLLVCTDSLQEARMFLRQHAITLIALRPGADVTGLMRSAGNPRNSLPFTVVLRDGHILSTHEGRLSAANLADISVAIETDSSAR